MKQYLIKIIDGKKGLYGEIKMEKPLDNNPNWFAHEIYEKHLSTLPFVAFAEALPNKEGDIVGENEFEWDYQQDQNNEWKRVGEFEYDHSLECCRRKFAVPKGWFGDTQDDTNRSVVTKLQTALLMLCKRQEKGMELGNPIKYVKEVIEELKNKI